MNTVTPAEDDPQRGFDTIPHMLGWAPRLPPAEGLRHHAASLPAPPREVAA